MLDYTICYKSNLPVDGPWGPCTQWDLFVSCFNSSERVLAVYDKVVAREKHWLILPDYQYTQEDLPDGRCFEFSSFSESAFVSEYIDQTEIDFAAASICIDITGFVKPYMMCFLKMLHLRGVKRYDVLYSEPDYYAEKEETTFSSGPVLSVRQVYGFEGSHGTGNDRDLLIIGAGYDHKLISYAAQHKEKARKHLVFGLPSLQPMFYQENILRAQRAFEEARDSRDESDFHMAPANDPFVVASVLREIVNSEAGWTNLYLCPVATKPQALGFVLYYLNECEGKASSMIYPFCEQHERATSKGLSRIWRYTVEFE